MSLSTHNKRPSPKWARTRIFTQGVIGLFALALCVSLFLQRWNNRKLASGNSVPLFAQTYPVTDSLREELEVLRQSGKLTSENEALIERTILSVSENSSIPRGLLWCLLFQESRLNHELGLHSDSAVHGLGQFSSSGFHEVNYQIDRFHAANSALLINSLGKDVRPIGPDKRRPQSVSSYYYIPTAVAASASYLNSRFYHLKGLLKKRGLDHNDDVLWLYAAMAYNKGTRSVLSIWNHVQQTRGEAALGLALTDLRAFRSVCQDRALLNRSFKQIWPRVQAEAYAKELSTHAQSIASCAVEKNLNARTEGRP